MKVLIKNRQRLIRTNPQNIICDSRKALRLLGLKENELSILLVNNSGMKALNSMHRHIGKTTDVLSFPQNERSAFSGQLSAKESIQNFVLGDVVINLQAAKRQATEHGLSFHEEIRWLLVHGILHLIGYDHEKSRYAGRKMREKEKKLLKYMGSIRKGKA